MKHTTHTGRLFFLTVALSLAPMTLQAAKPTPPSGVPDGTQPTETTETPEPKPSFHAKTGELRIPCLEVKGIVVQGKPIEDAKYDVVMKQRGQSSNWEITFANPGCGGQMPDPETEGDETETTEETTTE
jgi:hypothetical protein